MAEPNQYLRLRLGETNYLLPCSVSYTIEQRDNLLLNNSPDGNVVAWRVDNDDRWPAYSVDSSLRVFHRKNWQRVVFIGATPDTVGIIVDEVQVLPPVETPVVSFVPLGACPTRQGHLFSGAWIDGQKVTLVFDPKTLVAYLQDLGGAT